MLHGDESGRYLSGSYTCGGQQYFAPRRPGYSCVAVEKSQRVAERHRASVKMYYDAGGRIAMGTDAGTPFNRHGENALELEYMVDIGMSPLDAWYQEHRQRPICCVRANVVGLSQAVLPGLLVVNGDPCETITMASRKENHRLVVKNGVAI
ncbi:MAG: hypothetical protein Ct9H300mP13_2220 [Gammaproteobacteria bacterium]|nr:MAG: hypothetical protein Ct9H300mP13_2220 [Gammaproteobacteria bacterium]